ncbi:unnamed protein product [Closterium sp. NIES-64]|nr:unnamed protein product [Closterium sp. NIES-64]
MMRNIGTVVEGAADFYSSRLTRRERKHTPICPLPPTPLPPPFVLLYPPTSLPYVPFATCLAQFQIGTVVEGAADFYSSRLTRRERKQSFAAELLHDEDLKKYRKRKFLEIAEENQRKGRRHLVKKQDRKNPTWARAAPNDDEVEEWRAGDSDNDGGENAHGDNAEAAADAQEAAVDANEEADDEGGAELETVAPADAAAIADADAVAESDKVATDAVLFDEEGGDDDPWSLGTDDDVPLLKRRLRHRLRSKSKRARVVLSDDDGPGEERRPILTAVEKGKAKVAEAPAKAPA